jgi:hypothetical protein
MSVSKIPMCYILVLNLSASLFLKTGQHYNLRLCKGPLNNLTGKKLYIKTGTNTVVETDFNIRGLPDVKSATYNFPNLKIISGKKILN